MLSVPVAMCPHECDANTQPLSFIASAIFVAIFWSASSVLLSGYWLAEVR